MNRKLIAVIVLGLVLLASLLACGYFGLKTIRRTRLRHAAMDAYEKKDYILAERLLHAYVQQDPNAEAEFVALADIYHEFGNIGAEAQMWQTASSLNPLKQEYYENMLTCAVNAASYPLLHSILGRKAKVGEDFTDQELYLYVISSYRTEQKKDGDDASRKAIEKNREAFQKNELGQLAEFLFNYPSLSEAECNNFLSKAAQSDDPVTRYEALYTTIARLMHRSSNESDEGNIEALLKQAVETNYYAGTPLLADFYFSHFRFGDVIDILEPYLKRIDNIDLYLLYAESCVFTGKLDELKALKQKLLRKPGSLRFMADYCDILIAYMEDDEEKLDAAIRKSGKFVNSPLSCFARLRIAVEKKSFNEILTVAQELFAMDPFYDLHNRALLICLDYLSEEMKKAENQKDPSLMAELAKILSGYVQGNRLLTDIILMDQFKKGLVKEADLMAAMKEFPGDAILMRIASEYLILEGKSEQALPIIKQIISASEAEEQEVDHAIKLLHMLALDQVGQRDDAVAVFQDLVEQTDFDTELISKYFLFCVENKLDESLTSMADKLDSVKDEKTKKYGIIFRAAVLLLSGDEAKEKEALDILASTQTDVPDFTFYAANRLCEHDRLEEAEAKYKELMNSFHTPVLLYVNLSEIYHEKGDEAKALDAAKSAFDIEKKSMLPAFIYATRLSEAKRYEEAVGILNFPHHAVNYRKDIVELWGDCMHHVIENSIAGERYMQAEDQCKHLLTISPDDEFGKENLKKVQKLIRQQNVKGHSEQTAPAA